MCDLKCANVRNSASHVTRFLGKENKSYFFHLLPHSPPATTASKSAVITTDTTTKPPDSNTTTRSVAHPVALPPDLLHPHLYKNQNPFKLDSILCKNCKSINMKKLKISVKISSKSNTIQNKHEKIKDLSQDLSFVATKSTKSTSRSQFLNNFKISVSWQQPPTMDLEFRSRVE